jgi:alanine-glyoxylate transaminase/serine-glyoxylate transaminase/serine-pyruvate transaminase
MTDDWGLDVVFTCTQKGLSCPPGMAPISFSSRAVEAIHARKTKVPNWYLDVSLLSKYWGADRAYHHTAPISMAYALREGLSLVLEEGLDARFARHIRNQGALKAGLQALGLSYVAAEAFQAPQVHAVRIPNGVDDLTVRKRLLNEWNIEIGGGLGSLKGKAWRIGLMGQGSTQRNVSTLLAALETCLRDSGHTLKPGAALEAAAAAYAGTHG